MVNFILSHRGMTEFLLSPELAADMESRVKNVADVAKSIAPVETGSYKHSIESGTFHDGDRTTGYVSANVPYALDVEARDRVLGFAVDGRGEDT